jgi:hypothetical protein
VLWDIKMSSTEDEDIEQEWELTGSLLDKTDDSFNIMKFNKEIANVPGGILERAKARFEIMMRLTRPFYVLFRNHLTTQTEEVKNKVWMAKVLTEKLSTDTLDKSASELLTSFRESYTIFYLLFCESVYPNWDHSYKEMVDDGQTVNIGFISRTVIRLHHVLRREVGSAAQIVCFVATYLTYYKRILLEDKTTRTAPIKQMDEVQKKVANV